jgi:acetate kinase
VLALNSGSSSLKFQVLDIDARSRDEPRRLAKGLIERIGGPARLTLEAQGHPAQRDEATIADHDAAVRRTLGWARASVPPLHAVGHRVVHGGNRYRCPVVIDARVDTALEDLEALAPLHNGPNLAGIRACRRELGDRVPSVAVFDTAFHAGLPEPAARYAIPEELSRRHGIRRFGFHGISYQSVLSRYCRLTRTPPSEATLVALHLGNGASATAIKNGRSVDTSMGFTPLEGLVMGTRSGDLDPALVGHLARVEGVSVDEVERWLNERSGLLGLSGVSRDMRELMERAGDDERARLAVEVFCYRARKYLGAYLAVLGGARAVVFTGGIGEHWHEVRARICADMDWCGLTLDPRLNAELSGREGPISPPSARIQAWVIPTDEELVIAQATFDCLDGQHRRLEPRAAEEDKR